MWRPSSVAMASAIAAELHWGQAPGGMYNISTPVADDGAPVSDADVDYNYMVILCNQ